MSKVYFTLLYFTLLCFTLLCDWSRQLAPFSQPIRFKTKTNHARFFPRFRQFCCLDFKFSLVLKGSFLYFDWHLWILGFGFSTRSQTVILFMNIHLRTIHLHNQSPTAASTCIELSSHLTVNWINAWSKLQRIGLVTDIAFEKS